MPAANNPIYSITRPARASKADGELIAAGRHAQPDFLPLLHGRHVPVCVYCFNLIELLGRDLRHQPLVQRRAGLQALLTRAKCDLPQFRRTLERSRHPRWL